MDAEIVAIDKQRYVMRCCHLVVTCLDKVTKMQERVSDSCMVGRCVIIAFLRRVEELSGRVAKLR